MAWIPSTATPESLRDGSGSTQAALVGLDIRPLRGVPLRVEGGFRLKMKADRVSYLIK